MSDYAVRNNFFDIEKFRAKIVIARHELRTDNLKSQVGARGGTMSVELNLVFPDKDHVSVHFDGTESGALEFTNPLTAKDRKDIQWYLEVYGTHWSDEPDDIEARRIADQLPVLGQSAL